MPGIAGIIKKNGDTHGMPSIDSMVRCMVHERFHKAGTYVNEELGLAAGWVALQGSFSDCMPVWNEQKDICLIFSGETFTDPAEVNDLRGKGHEVKSLDASWLVHLYEEAGSHFLERLNGWFSGVLVDLRQQKILVFNDRYGVNRIFHHEDEKAFYFSSEAKSLLRVVPSLRQLDLVSLGEFLSCTAILQNRTLFRGVRALPGGSVLTFSPCQPVRSEVYFRPESLEQQDPLNASDFFDKFSEIWARILPRYFQGAEKMALSLTGGVDSRMILACAGLPPGTLPCYTFGGRYRDSRDVTISRLVARICDQQHQTIHVGNEFLSDFPSLAAANVYLSDGAMDVAGAVDLYVQRLARQIAPVRLSGVYGGEILRRLVMFKPRSPNPSLLGSELTRSVLQAAATYREELLQDHPLSFTAFKQAPWYMTAKFAVERSQVTFRTPYFDNELVALVYRTPSELSSSNEPALRLIAGKNPVLSAVGTDRGLALKSLPGVAQALHFYQEFIFKAEYAYDYGMPQWLAKTDHVFASLRLERLFLGRHKFHHFRIWYREELSQFVKDILLDPRSLGRSYFNRACLEKMVNDHVKGTRNYTTEIHKLLSIELVQRQLIEQKGFPETPVETLAFATSNHAT